MESVVQKQGSHLYFLDEEGLTVSELTKIYDILHIPSPSFYAETAAVGQAAAITYAESEAPSLACVDQNAQHETVEPEVNVNDRDGIVYPGRPWSCESIIHDSNPWPNGVYPNMAMPPPNIPTMMPIVHPMSLVAASLCMNPTAMGIPTTAMVTSMPSGIPSYPGFAMPMLHAGSPEMSFYRTQPPPSVTTMNPRVQEFVPGQEYIMRTNDPLSQSNPGQESVAVQHLHHMHPPQCPYLELPVTGHLPVDPVAVTGPTLMFGSVDPQSIASLSARQSYDLAPAAQHQVCGLDGTGSSSSGRSEVDIIQQQGSDSGKPTGERIWIGQGPQAARTAVSQGVPPQTLSPCSGQPTGISSTPAGVKENSAAEAAKRLGTCNKLVTSGLSSPVSSRTDVSDGPGYRTHSPSSVACSASSVRKISSSDSKDLADTSLKNEPVVKNFVKSVHLNQQARTSTGSAFSGPQPVATPANVSCPKTPPSAVPLVEFPAQASDHVRSPPVLINGDISDKTPSPAVTVSGKTMNSEGIPNDVTSDRNKISSNNISNSTSVALVSPSSTTTTSALPIKSWANLFKDQTGQSTHTSAVVALHRQEEEKSPTVVRPAPSAEVVPIGQDSVASNLGEYLSKAALIHSSVALQPRGLVNKGNWCYVNATLQALLACPPFYHLFKKLADLHLLSRSASSTPILDSLVHFTSEFSKYERQAGHKRGKPVELISGPAFEPDYVYQMLQVVKASSSFKHGRQEDAEEFLSCMLDGLHEEMLAAMNFASGGENGMAQTNGFAQSGNDDGLEASDGEPDTDDSWQEVGPKNKGVHTCKASTIANTPIAKIFAGSVRSGVLQAANKERATMQPFFTLQLDIQGEKVTSVREALEGFVSKESIQGYTCSKTGEEVEVMKRTTLEELPPVLILHLKCFVYDQTGGSQKLMKNIKFEVDLQITKDLLSSKARSKMQSYRNYKLFAVVFHHGKKATGGHYTTDVFHPGVNGWVHMDDNRILMVSESEVLNYRAPKMPYLLYYRRRDLTNSSS